MPGPVSSIGQRRAPCGRRQRIVMRARPVDGLDGVLQDVDQRLLELPAIDVDPDRRRLQLPAPGDAAALSLAASSATCPAASARDRSGLVSGGGRRKTSAKRRMKLPSCSVRSMTMPIACLEVVTVARRQLSGVGERRVQQRVRGGDGVVHLVGHHADQLLVGRALGLAQLFGQLLDQRRSSAGSRDR